MAEAWPENEQQRTRDKIEGNRCLPRNGKIFFKRTDRSRAFIYEAELDKGLLHMRPLKESHTFTAYASIGALLADGWIIE